MNTILELKGDKRLLIILAGSAFAGLLTLYAIYRYRKNLKTPANDQSDSQVHEINDRILYEQNIVDKHQFSFVNYPIERNSNISDIFYKIIMNFNKGNIYQGVVKLSFFIKNINHSGKDFKLNYNGTSVKYLSVNGKVLDPAQIQYDDHAILFNVKFLKEKQTNKIQVIFENKYSFLDDGLSSYFILDQSNKYSLKQQVIYTKNGPFQIQRIMPCLNILNECKVSLQIIYPEGFQSFSNTPKSLDRQCTAHQYPQYSFFFTLPERGLNKSFKLNSSFTTSNFDSSTLNASSQTKRNSHFFTSSMLSIHNLFAFCSNMVQIPNSSSFSNTQNKVIIRYFGKFNKLSSLSKHISTLNRHIIDICNRLSQFKVQKCITKIDIFFLADREIQGYYIPGAILLDEESMTHGVHIKTFYLIARAIFGMIKQIDYKTHFMNQKVPLSSPLRNHLSLESNIWLNQTIFQRFPQCRGYLFFKQQDIQKARSFLQRKQFLDKYSLRFQQYYYKESKFLLSYNFLNSLAAEKIPFQFKDISARLKNNDCISYWSHFITQYNFLSPYVAQLLLKISIDQKGIPFGDPDIIQFAKKNFSKSKFYLNFFTNEEIQNNLPYFMESKFHHLQNRLTQIKIKEKFREYITDQYESYLPIKSNKLQAKSIYDQFKRFKQNRNFHHVSVLKHQIKRIRMFGKDFITREKLNLQCGFMGWKLLNKILIYPSNPDYKKVIYQLQQQVVCSDSTGGKIKKSKDFQQ